MVYHVKPFYKIIVHVNVSLLKIKLYLYGFRYCRALVNYESTLYLYVFTISARVIKDVSFKRLRGWLFGYTSISTMPFGIHALL